jgi:hypothetical protein
MKKVKVVARLFFICLIISLICQCRKDKSILLDKKITLDLFDNPMGNGFTYLTYIFSTVQTNFSISDYQNIDSVSFVINDLYIKAPNGNIVTNDTLRIELVNMANNNPIENAMIITTGIDKSKCLATRNLYNEFVVNNPINIGIKMSFKGKGAFDGWFLGHASLVLVRK